MNSRELAAVDGRAVVEFGVLLGRFGELTPLGGIGEELRKGTGEGSGFGRGYEQSGLLVRDDFGDATDPGSDDGDAGHHGLEQGIGRAFRV